MLDCWEASPKKRPSFTELRLHLESLIEDMSAAKYLNIEVDENRDYYMLEDENENESNESFHRSTANSMPEMSMMPIWTPITASLTDENLSIHSLSINSTIESGGYSLQDPLVQLQANAEAANAVSKPMAIPRVPVRASTDSLVTGQRKSVTMFRTSTCSSDELIPHSGSTNDGGIVLDCCSLRSVGETNF